MLNLNVRLIDNDNDKDKGAMIVNILCFTLLFIYFVEKIAELD